MCIVLTAARNAIRPRLVAFKFHALNEASVCHLTGVPLTFESAYACHASDLTLKELFARFVAEQGIDVDTVLVNGLLGRTHLSDPDLRRRWFAFHVQHARLVLVDRNEWLRRHGGDPEREEERRRQKEAQVALERAELQAKRDAEVIARYLVDAVTLSMAA